MSNKTYIKKLIRFDNKVSGTNASVIATDNNYVDEEIVPCCDEEMDCDCRPIEGKESNSIFGEERNIHDLKREDERMHQWSTSGDGVYRPTANTVKRLESGYYNIAEDNYGVYLQKIDVKLNKLYPLPNKATEIIMNDISKFWGLKENYDKYNRVFRRNYLIYSEPGTGKTSLINLMCKELIDKYDGIVFQINSRGELSCLVTAMYWLRRIEPDRKVIIVIEDFDNYVSPNDNNNRDESCLLNVLDGNGKFYNAVTIATTNYIGKIAERYTNRPSRFDRVIEFAMPNSESRRMFIEKTVLPEDLKKINLDNWVERTKGFTIDHINELIVLYFVFGHEEEECFETVENMINENSRLETKTIRNANKTKIGFNKTLTD